MIKRLSRAAVLAAALLLTLPAGSVSASSTPNYDDYSRQVLQDGPAAYYRLNETSGTTARDLTGNGLNATIGANVGLNAPSVLAHEIQPQMQFQTSIAAPTVPAAADVVTTPASAVLQPTTAVTIEALVKMPSGFPNSNSNFIIAGQGFQTATPYEGYGIGCHVLSGTPSICQPQAFLNGAAVNQYGGIAGIPAGSYAHIAETYNQTSVILYVNGYPVGSASKSTAISYPSVTPTIIGGADVGNTASFYEFPGQISEVAIYPTALSAARILAHANAAKGFQTYTAAQLATTTTPGTTTGRLHQLVFSNLLNVTNQATYTPAQWVSVSNHVDISERTLYNNSAINGQVGHGIMIGSYIDTSRSCTYDGTHTCGQGGAANTGNLAPTSVLQTCDGLSPVFWQGTNDGHNTVNDYTSSTLATDVNTQFAAPFAVMHGNFIFADNVLPPDEMTSPALNYGTVTSGNSVVTYNLGLGFPATNATPTCVNNPLAPAVANALLPKTLYTRANWIAGMASTFQRIALPVIFNYISAGADVGNALYQLPNVVGGLKENLFGNGASQIKVGHPYFDTGENLILQATKFNRYFDDQEHTYGFAATNDVQGYMLAAEGLMYQDGLVAQEYDGTTVGAWGGITSPTQNMVFTNPEIPNSSIRSINDLLVGNIYARRFRDVYLNGTSVGACIVMVNPDVNNPATVPTFSTSYTQAVTVNNYVSSGAYKGAASELGDTGTISEATTTFPTTLPARGWSINCQ